MVVVGVNEVSAVLVMTGSRFGLGDPLAAPVWKQSASICFRHGCDAVTSLILLLTTVGCCCCCCWTAGRNWLETRPPVWLESCRFRLRQ